MDQKTIPSTRRTGEVRTIGGQVLRLEATPEMFDEVKAFIEAHAVFLSTMQSERVVSKGGCGNYSRYPIEQLKYAGGGYSGNGGFIEALEITDPPDERCGHVLYHAMERPFMLESNLFIEFSSKENLLHAFEQLWNHSDELNTRTPKQTGFLRTIDCGPLTPWFYATGNQELLGDVVIVPDWGNDPIYKVGQQYIVHTEYGQRLKTCMGAFTTNRPNSECRRYVLWHDGTYWNGSGEPPKAVKNKSYPVISSTTYR